MGALGVERWQPRVASTARRPSCQTLDGSSTVHDSEDQQQEQEQEQEEGTRQRHAHYSAMTTLPTATPALELALDSVHQTGTRYRSNSAGDGPEKTRDRKSWFPRFKSNWLGTFRSKQMFPCCECAVLGADSVGATTGAAARYKGAEGKHCRCGKDQWHLAKTVEETEYNRRMEVSKALGGMRYDEAVLRLRSMGTSEEELTRMAGSDQDAKRMDVSEHGLGLTQRTGARVYPPVAVNVPKRAPSVSSDPGVSLMGSNTRAYAPQLIKTELGGGPTSSVSTHSQVFGYDNSAKTYPTGVYSPLYATGSGSGEYTSSVGVSTSAGPTEYEQLAPAPYGDEEGFSELLQGILEDDPRAGTAGGVTLSPNGSYAPGRYAYSVPSGTPVAPGSVSSLKRTMSAPPYSMTEPPASDMTYYQDPSRRTSAAPNLNISVNQPTQYHHYQLPPQAQPSQQPQTHMHAQQFPYQPQHPPQQQQSQGYGHSLPMTSNASF